MKVRKDGTLRFRKPLPMALKNYTQDESDPCLYHPNFPPCRLRYRPTQKTPCGKTKTGGWTCSINDQLVTVDICTECRVREIP